MADLTITADWTQPSGALFPRFRQKLAAFARLHRIRTRKQRLARLIGEADPRMFEDIGLRAPRQPRQSWIAGLM